MVSLWFQVEVVVVEDGVEDLGGAVEDVDEFVPALQFVFVGDFYALDFEGAGVYVYANDLVLVESSFIILDGVDVRVVTEERLHDGLDGGVDFTVLRGHVIRRFFLCF